MATIENIISRINTDFHPDPRFILNRLVMSKAFHRLAGKTQIFPAGSHDHVQTRLTHTLTVVDLSRFLAYHLKANETYVEIMAIAHDLGHTPFGHAGERVLNRVMNGCYQFARRDAIQPKESVELGVGLGFKHNYQSARLCTSLEKFSLESLIPSDYSMRMIVHGIISHSSLEWEKCPGKNDEGERCNSPRVRPKCQYSLSYYNKFRIYLAYRYYTVEADIVAIADEVAQRQHDILDAYIMGVLSYRDIQSYAKRMLKGQKEAFDIPDSSIDKDYRAVQQLAISITEYYLRDIIETTRKKGGAVSDDQLNDKQQLKKLLMSSKLVSMSEELQKRDKQLKKILKTSVLNSHHVQRLDGVAEYIITKLYEAYISNPMQLHDPTVVAIMNRYMKAVKRRTRYKNQSRNDCGRARITLNRLLSKDDEVIKAILLRGITDHIAGMTDTYAMQEYKQLYGHNMLI